MIAHAFDDGERARVAHGEALARAARGVELAAGRAVQTGVADDRRFVARKTRASRRTHDDAAAGHALADAVVRFAVEHDVHAACVPRAEALTRGAGQAQRDRIRRHALIAVLARDLTGNARADRAVGVDDRVVELAARSVFDRRFRVRGDAFGEIALRNRRRGAGRRVLAQIRAEQRRQIELVLLHRRAFALAEQIGAADDLVEPARAKARQMRTHVLGDEAEEVDDLLGRAVVVFLA